MNVLRLKFSATQTAVTNTFSFFLFFSSREPVLKLPEEKPLVIVIVQLFLLKK